MRLLSVRGRVAALAIAGMLGATVVAFAETKAPPAKAQLGLAVEPNEAGSSGVIVRGFGPESPAEKAGLKEGDRIVKADSKKVESFDDLRGAVSKHKPGDKLALTVVRDGKEQSFTVTLGKETQRPEAVAEGAEKTSPFLGVFTQPLNAEMKDHLHLKMDKGALVTRVMPGSPAAKAGLAELDVITGFGDTPVSGPQDLRQAVEKAGAGKDVTLKVTRGDKEMQIKAQLGAEKVSAAPFGRQGRMPAMPEEFKEFQGRVPMFLHGQDKMAELEKQVKELENRVKQLEKNQAKPAN
jgi:S1-C subfamily serine protease